MSHHLVENKQKQTTIDFLRFPGRTPVELLDDAEALEIKKKKDW